MRSQYLIFLFLQPFYTRLLFVSLGGAAATILKGRGALQDIDQISLFKSICKSCSTVKCVRDIAPTLRKAICEAQSGTPGMPSPSQVPDLQYFYSYIIFLNLFYYLFWN